MTKDNRAIAQSFIDAIPHSHALGMKFDFVGDGEAHMSMDYDERFIGDPATGVIHGGAVFALLDTCGGAAVFRILITMGRQQRLICVWITCALHRRDSVFAPWLHVIIAPVRWPLSVPLPWMIAKINLWPRPQGHL